jgi:hypothetical protein
MGTSCGRAWRGIIAEEADETDEAKEVILVFHYDRKPE